jgi:hypothetical protein
MLKGASTTSHSIFHSGAKSLLVLLNDGKETG